MADGDRAVRGWEDGSALSQVCSLCGGLTSANTPGWQWSPASLVRGWEDEQPWTRERIFIELMTSNRKLMASREGSE